MDLKLIVKTDAARKALPRLVEETRGHKLTQRADIRHIEGDEYAYNWVPPKNLKHVEITSQIRRKVAQALMTKNFLRPYGLKARIDYEVM